MCNAKGKETGDKVDGIGRRTVSRSEWEEGPCDLGRRAEHKPEEKKVALRNRYN